MTFVLTLSFLCNVVLQVSADAHDWNTQAQSTLQDAVNLLPNQGVAKNVIFFVGDGMDVGTTTAARILRGQLDGYPGEEGSLAWDTFPHVALSKTYNVNQQVPDSAATATALFCGVKTNAGTLGIDESGERGSCDSVAGAEVDSILIQANRAGKATGFITTTRVTHATPASTYAHSADRDWEYNEDVPREEADKGCIDIARQLVEENSFINVILGGGRNRFLPNTTLDPEYGHQNMTGSRTDGKNLIDQWQLGKGTSARFVWNETAFQEVDFSQTEFLLGLFEPSHLNFESSRLNDTGGEPSIGDMTEKAIEMLRSDDDGFFLMIEAGRIDHGHHRNVAHKALFDTLALHDAVSKAVEMTDSSDTLIIVTADHGHTMSFAGYPSRGNPIFGYDNRENGSDNLPFLTLSYGNGPGGIKLADSYLMTGERRNHFNSESDIDGFVQDATIPRTRSTHGGADVAIYAHGPWAHLFHGTHEQNYVPHVVRYAACYLDDQANACTRSTDEPPICTGDAGPAQRMNIVLLIVVFIAMMEIQVLLL